MAALSKIDYGKVTLWVTVGAFLVGPPIVFAIWIGNMESQVTANTLAVRGSATKSEVWVLS